MLHYTRHACTKHFPHRCVQMLEVPRLQGAVVLSQVLLAALRRRDPELAEARMRAHVRRSLRAGGLDGALAGETKRKRQA